MADGTVERMMSIVREDASKFWSGLLPWLGKFRRGAHMRLDADIIATCARFGVEVPQAMLDNAMTL